MIIDDAICQLLVLSSDITTNCGEANVPERSGGRLCSRVTTELGRQIVAGNYVPNQVREANVNLAMTNNLGFGGHNASLIFKKYEA